MLAAGPEDPFLPAQFAGLLASAIGMVVGSIAPQVIVHNPHIHDELRGHRRIHPAAATSHVPAHLHPHHRSR
jgi:hypothetical protein